MKDRALTVITYSVDVYRHRRNGEAVGGKPRVHAGWECEGGAKTACGQFVQGDSLADSGLFTLVDVHCPRCLKRKYVQEAVKAERSREPATRAWWRDRQQAEGPGGKP